MATVQTASAAGHSGSAGQATETTILGRPPLPTMITRADVQPWQ